MIERQIASKLKKLAAIFPAVTIEGPRQSGKTTLAKMAFPDYRYANLEESAVRRLAQTDVRGFFEKFPAPAMARGLEKFKALAPDVDDGYVIYGGEAWPLDGGAYVNFRETGSLIEKICDNPSP